MKSETLMLVNTANGYTIISGTAHAESLCPDEALGVVGSWIFGEKPIHLRTPEEQVAWLKSLRRAREETEGK